MRTIIVGTRQSGLALTQTGQVVERLREISIELGKAYEFRLEKIVTKGDRILDVTLSKVGGKGLFVKEIEQAMLDRKIDLAVHSLKDMPASLPEGLTIGCYTKRVDARDCLISHKGLMLEQLPREARIGTSSLRRASQLKHYRPDLQIEAIRGNIDSRIKKLDTEGFDAIILAAAGLLRMGWEERIDQYLPIEVCLPAVGQGALAIECREDDTAIRELLHHLNHPQTAKTVAAERSFLTRLNGGCQIPIGAYATLQDGCWDSNQVDHNVPSQGDAAEGCSNGGRNDGDIILTGIVGSPDGKQLLKTTSHGSDPDLLGKQVAEQLIAQGADRILAEMSE